MHFAFRNALPDTGDLSANHFSSVIGCLEEF